MHFKRTALATAVTTVFFLTACGGGGGGGGGSYLAPSPSSPTPNPTALVATINPLVTASTIGTALNMFTADLTNSGSQNVVVAGDFNGNNASAHINSKITVFGWNGNQMVDQTSQWFSGTDNVIVGTPKVTFGNFNGNGFQSMFIATGTDGQATSNNVQMFVNNGSRFTRYDIALPHSIDSNDSTIFNYNGIDNAIAIGSPWSDVIMGSNTNNFRVFPVAGVGGTSIAAGNFLGNNQPSFIVGQYGSSTCLGCQPDALLGFTFDGANVTMPYIRSMPVPLFNSTADYVAKTGGSNTVKVFKMDFDESGVDSAIVLAMPNTYQTSPWQSSIQFLKNNGTGVFTDVTANTVTGYDASKPPSTSPIIIDLLNTGLPDIVLPYSGGAQVLMQVAKGQYVANQANVINNFTGNIQTLLNAQGNGQTSANSTVTFVKGPNNNLYLLGMVPETINGTAANQFYFTPVTGNTVAVNAQSAITSARAAWPWLTDAQLNTMITATGMNFAGVPILDAESLLSPSGALTVANRSISGYIAGVQFGGADGQVVAMDQLGRSFNLNLSPMRPAGWSNSFNMDSEHIDQHELTSHTEYLISSSVNNYGPLRMGTETRNQYNTMFGDPNTGPVLGAQPVNYTVGMPRAYENGNWSGGMQYTTLNYNPWLGFAGAWGQVKQTNNLDTTVRYNNSGFTAVAGATYTTTTFVPGLIQKVSDIVGVWAETGYRYQNFGVYAGVKPVPVSGSVTANLPTSIDNTGNVHYTSKMLGLQNEVTSYIRALWTTDVNKKTMYRLSGTAMSNGQYRLMNELRFNFD